MFSRPDNKNALLLLLLVYVYSNSRMFAVISVSRINIDDRHRRCGDVMTSHFSSVFCTVLERTPEESVHTHINVFRFRFNIYTKNCVSHFYIDFSYVWTKICRNFFLLRLIMEFHGLQPEINYRCLIIVLWFLAVKFNRHIIFRYKCLLLKL